MTEYWKSLVALLLTSLLSIFPQSAKPPENSSDIPLFKPSTEKFSLNVRQPADDEICGIPENWTVDSSSGEGIAPVSFRFPPPFDEYRGVVTKLKGSLSNLGCTVENVRGSFEVAIDDVTLGDEELDRNVRHAVELLDGDRFPLSRFTIARIQGMDPRLVLGVTTYARIKGRFELKGKSIPIRVRINLAPFLDANLQPRLLMRGSFILEHLRETFVISGPGAVDNPQGNRLLFNLNLMFRPIPPG